MKKEKVPIEENVDIELEYKLLHLYDKIKPYIKFIIGAFLAFILAIVGYIYYKNKQNQYYQQASLYVLKIKNELEGGKVKEAKKDIKFFKANYADTPYMKLVYGYELTLAKKGKEKKDLYELSSQLKDSLSTDQMKGYITEYQASLDYSGSKFKDALVKVNKIDQSHFNYLSALTLKGLILKKEGKNAEAKEVFKEVQEFSKGKFRYFEQIAKNNLQ